MSVNNKIKRLLLVAHGAGLGGAERYVFEQAKLLVSQGYIVECIGFEGGELENLYKKVQIPFSICTISKLDDRIIGEIVCGYDMVIANTMYAIFFAKIAQMYTPTMLIIHECFSYMEAYFKRTSLACQELKQIKHVFGVSKYHIKTLKNWGLNSVHLLNNFVEDTFCPQYNRSSEEKIKFLTVANWNYVKGFDLALMAFECVAAEGNVCFEWNIVGQMTNEQSCIEFVNRAKAVPWICLYGVVSDKERLHQIYMNNDVYMQLSREDACPLAVVDAAMLQMPMIVSKDTGANYLAENGAGWIVDEFNTANTVSVIREVLQRRDELKSIGRRARKNYLANATPESYVNTIQREIEKIVNSKFMCSDINQRARNVPKIAFYGYNMHAQTEYFYSKKNSDYKLLGIYDQNYEQLRKKGVEAKNPEELRTMDLDYVCIYCNYKSTIHSIRKFLIQIGIPEEKICVGIEDVLKYNEKDLFCIEV